MKKRSSLGYNALALVLGLFGGFYSGQHLPDVYYYKIR